MQQSHTGANAQRNGRGLMLEPRQAAVLAAAALLQLAACGTAWKTATTTYKVIDQVNDEIRIVEKELTAEEWLDAYP